MSLTPLPPSSSSPLPHHQNDTAPKPPKPHLLNHFVSWIKSWCGDKPMNATITHTDKIFSEISRDQFANKTPAPTDISRSVTPNPSDDAIEKTHAAKISSAETNSAPTSPIDGDIPDDDINDDPFDSNFGRPRHINPFDPEYDSHRESPFD